MWMNMRTAFNRGFVFYEWVLEVHLNMFVYLIDSSSKYVQENTFWCCEHLWDFKASKSDSGCSIINKHNMCGVSCCVCVWCACVFNTTPHSYPSDVVCVWSTHAHATHHHCIPSSGHMGKYTTQTCNTHTTHSSNDHDTTKPSTTTTCDTRDQRMNTCHNNSTMHKWCKVSCKHGMKQ